MFPFDQLEARKVMGVGQLNGDKKYVGKNITFKNTF